MTPTDPHLPRGFPRESQIDALKRGAESCLSTALKTYGKVKRGFLLTFDPELQSREIGVYDVMAWCIRPSLGWMYDSELIVAEFIG